MVIVFLFKIMLDKLVRIWYNVARKCNMIFF